MKSYLILLTSFLFQTLLLGQTDTALCVKKNTADYPSPIEFVSDEIQSMKNGRIADEFGDYISNYYFRIIIISRNSQLDEMYLEYIDSHEEIRKRNNQTLTYQVDLDHLFEPKPEGLKLSFINWLGFSTFEISINGTNYHAVLIQNNDLEESPIVVLRKR